MEDHTVKHMIEDDFNFIIQHSHFWNWLPDWSLVKEIYECFPDSYSILTPFAYSYLEELVRSTTSDYGMTVVDKNGKEKKHIVGYKLIDLAIKENLNNTEYINLLEETKKYFVNSTECDRGDNRNSTNHGYMHPRFWTKQSFEGLIHHIACLSKYAKF